MDKRTAARVLAMQALYQLDVQGSALFDTLDSFFAENNPDTTVCKQARKWACGTWENITQVDELLEDCTIKWRLSRLSAVDKSILRLAVYQLAFCQEIPPKVVINEGIELAKKFGSEKSPAFVNGVLDAALRKLQTQDGKSET